MLGRLFSSAGSHGRSPSSLESTIEEKHTRNLLFSDTPLSSSPVIQGTAAGLKFGTFDDYNGFMVEEKDIRIIIAQEDQERPSILFDTNVWKGRSENASSPRSPKVVSSIRHERATSSAASSKSYFGSQPEISISSSLRSPTGTSQVGNRGSATSALPCPPPPSALRETDSRDFDLLECMFGASSAKSGTKIHLIKSSNKLSRVSSSPLVSPVATSSRNLRKPPLGRAQTSGAGSTNTGHAFCDMVLITRIFTVAPPGFDKEISDTASKSTATLVEESNDPPGRSKPPKLREKKTPAYAVSLVVQLPRQERSRPQSRQGEAQYHSPPASSSFGSDLQSSWTFLDTLPPSLSTPRSSQQPTVDSNIDFVLRRWDAAVRNLSIIEKVARSRIFSLLSQVDDTSSGRKTPKEKRMQRINQKIIRLPALSLVDDEELRKTSLQAINFVCNAFLTPSVRPMPGGHWLAEARMVTEKCNQKNFLAVLLSAFLGNHFEWINEIGQELHEKLLLLKWKSQQDKFAMRSRTVIICEDRILARRLVYILASFLFPGMQGLRSISDPSVHRPFTRPREQTTTGMDHLMNGELSKSASSAEEDLIGHYIPANRRRKLHRNQSETNSLRTARLPIPRQDPSFHKSSAGTTTTVTPNPSTPLAHVITVPQASDSYFANAPTEAVSASAAAASLQRLRRSSSTASSIPSTWGSLLGSIWSNKQTSSSNTTVPSDGLASTSTNSQISQFQAPTSQLESMAQEVGTADSPVKSQTGHFLLSPEQPAQDVPPRLEVDERDGVVDVDLKPPSAPFESYALSLDILPAFPTPMSTSTASLDDTRSFFSVGSNLRTSADHVNNIAGYLKQYQPDFVLQAVRSCSEKEVRDSMTHMETEGPSPGSSYEACNTLIADVRNYSVKRITLRRKERNSEKEPDQEPPTSWHDEFSLESISSFDETLADAIDRALDRPSAVPSRLPSPSPSKSRHYRTASTSTTSTVNAPSPLATSFTPASTKDTLQPMPVPQRKGSQLIIDALKEVVGEVDRDLHSSKRSGNIPTSANSKPPTLKTQKTEENVLREGVKRWLQGAEETSVW